VVPRGPVEKIPPDGLEQAAGDAQSLCRDAVAEILCDMLMAAASECRGDPSFGGK
jgi:hypothetical protein